MEWDLDYSEVDLDKKSCYTFSNFNMRRMAWWDGTRYLVLAGRLGVENFNSRYFFLIIIMACESEAIYVEFSICKILILFGII